MPSRRILAAIAVTSITAVAGSASPALADSFAYIKGGDVFLTTTDGARQFQVTGTGGYTSISQADDGTLLAATVGNDLVRLDRFGAALSDIPTPISQSTNGGSTVFDGPEAADISPDGRSAGYGFLKLGAYRYPDGTMDADLYNGAGFTRSDTLTGFLDAGYKYSRDWDAPEFIDNQTVLLSNGPGYPSTPFAIEKLGSGDPQSWFSDGNNMHPLDATISRNLRYIAAVHGPDRKTLEVYRDGDQKLLSGNLQDCFTYSDAALPDPQFNSPTFNADGTLLAYGDSEGLFIAPIGDGSAACPSGQNGRVVVPGASGPDWGPADVPAARPADRPLPGRATAGAAAPAGTGTPGPAATPASGAGAHAGATALSVHAEKGRIAVTLRKGLVVTVTAPSSGRVAIAARSGRTTIGSGAATAKAGRRVSVRVRFTAAARRRLAHARRVTLTLTVRQGATRQTARVTLTR